MQNNKTIERKTFRLITVIALLICAGLSAIVLSGCDNIKALIPDGSTTEQPAPRGIYTVTFDGNGGVLDDVYKLQTTPDGRLEAFPPAPVHSDPLRSFYCWTLQKDNADTRLSLLYTYSADTTVYALWTSNSGSDPSPSERMQCLVTFDANGGTVSGVNSVTRRTDENGKLEDLPTEPIKQGQIFDGWYLTIERNDGDKVLPGRIFDVDTTVYATWRDKIEYTVTFDANGGQLTDDGTIKTDEYGKLTVRPTDPERAGYAFDGWYSNFEEPYGKRYALNTAFTEDTTLYAKWRQEVFVINFDANGGTLTGDGVMETGTDGRLEFFPPDPVHSDPKLYFAGWGLTSDATGVISLAHVFRSDTTLYAVWTDESSSDGESTETFTLSFYRNYDGISDESAVDKYTFPKGKVLVRFPELVRDGYNHIGWMISPNDGNTVTIGLDGYTVTRDAQFYAKWTIKTSDTTAPVNNVVSGLNLAGRVYNGNSNYIVERERQLAEMKNDLRLNDFALTGQQALEKLKRICLIQTSECDLHTLNDADGQQVGEVRGPDNVKYGFLFDLPETKAAFACSFSNPECNVASQSVTVAFGIVPNSEYINLADYEITLEETSVFASGVAMNYRTLYNGNGQAYINGVLVFSYSAMISPDVAAFVKLTALTPSTPFTLNFELEDNTAGAPSYSDAYIRETFIVYEEDKIRYFYVLNAPFVFIGAHTNLSGVHITEPFLGVFAIERFIYSTSTNGHFVVSLTVDGRFSTLPAEQMSGIVPSVSFITSGGAPVPVKVDPMSGEITLDYMYPFALDFTICFCDDTGGYYISWNCGDGMGVAKIILRSTAYDVSGKGYIDLSQKEVAGGVVFVLA